MSPLRTALARSCWTAVALFSAAFPCLGAEHITLKNGFDLVCDHREAAGDHVRLYMTPGSDSFMEVRAAEITSIEEAPAIPVAAPASRPAGITAAEPTAAELHQILAKAGAAHNLDVDLLASVIQAESGGNVHALSRTGAQGLMQLMPGTAAELGVHDSYAAEENVGGGTAYLNALLERYHDNLSLALAAYNAGPAAVDRYHGIPPYRETRAYVARVIHTFNQRKSMAARTGKAFATTRRQPGVTLASATSHPAALSTP